MFFQKPISYVGTEESVFPAKPSTRRLLNNTNKHARRSQMYPNDRSARGTPALWPPTFRDPSYMTDTLHSEATFHPSNPRSNYCRRYPSFTRLLLHGDEQRLQHCDRMDRGSNLRLVTPLFHTSFYSTGLTWARHMILPNLGRSRQTPGQSKPSTS